MAGDLARGQGATTGRLDTAEDLAWHLDALLRLDPRLVAIAERAGAFEVRRTVGGFAGLARIVTGQQVSTQSADAIWGRFAALPGALDAAGYLALDEAAIRGAGFSAGKHTTLRAVAEALLDGRLDLDALSALPAEAAIAGLTAHRGIGPWTAEIYLMFCAGHPDVFPAGDVALQRAVQWGFGLDDKPPVRSLIATATEWSPHRSTAALLLWRYYRAVRNKEGLSLS